MGLGNVYHMFTFTGTLLQLNFNKDKYRKTIDELLKRQVRQAARAWVRAVLPHVPVWTGTARGTLLPISRILGIANTISPVKVKHGFGPEVGASFGTFSFFDGSDGIYGFYYDINLEYYAENEFYPAPAKYRLKNPTPWHSFKAGDKAFQDYIDNTLPQRLPNLIDFIEVINEIRL